MKQKTVVVVAVPMVSGNRYDAQGRNLVLVGRPLPTGFSALGPPQWVKTIEQNNTQKNGVTGTRITFIIRVAFSPTQESQGNKLSQAKAQKPKEKRKTGKNYLYNIL